MVFTIQVAREFINFGAGSTVGAGARLDNSRQFLQVWFWRGE